MKVKVIRNVVDTGTHYGKKGAALDLPDDVAKRLIAAKAVEPVKGK